MLPVGRAHLPTLCNFLAHTHRHTLAQALADTYLPDRPRSAGPKSRESPPHHRNTRAGRKHLRKPPRCGRLSTRFVGPTRKATPGRTTDPALDCSSRPPLRPRPAGRILTGAAAAQEPSSEAARARPRTLPPLARPERRYTAIRQPTAEPAGGVPVGAPSKHPSQPCPTHTPYSFMETREHQGVSTGSRAQGR